VFRLGGRSQGSFSSLPDVLLGRVRVHPFDFSAAVCVCVFSRKNRLNLAKGLKATQVHNSDTPAFLTEIGGEWWAVHHNINEYT
jgi:hypothetical protein